MRLKIQSTNVCLLYLQQVQLHLLLHRDKIYHL
jgi:hypothetical protein